MKNVHDASAKVYSYQEFLNTTISLMCFQILILYSMHDVIDIKATYVFTTYLNVCDVKKKEFFFFLSQNCNTLF